MVVPRRDQRVKAIHGSGSPVHKGLGSAGRHAKQHAHNRSERGLKVVGVSIAARNRSHLQLVEEVLYVLLFVYRRFTSGLFVYARRWGKVHTARGKVVVKHDVGIYCPKLRNCAGVVVSRVVGVEGHVVGVQIASGRTAGTATRYRIVLHDYGRHCARARDVVVHAVALKAHGRRRHQRHQVSLVYYVVNREVILVKDIFVYATLRRLHGITKHLGLVAHRVVPGINEALAYEVGRGARARVARHPKTNLVCGDVVALHVAAYFSVYLVGGTRKACGLGVPYVFGLVERNVAGPLRLVVGAADGNRYEVIVRVFAVFVLEPLVGNGYANGVDARLLHVKVVNVDRLVVAADVGHKLTCRGVLVYIAVRCVDVARIKVEAAHSHAQGRGRQMGIVRLGVVEEVAVGIEERGRKVNLLFHNAGEAHVTTRYGVAVVALAAVHFRRRGSRRDLAHRLALPVGAAVLLFVVLAVFHIEDFARRGTRVIGKVVSAVFGCKVANAVGTL